MSVIKPSAPDSAAHLEAFSTKELDGHLAFAKQITERYPWSEQILATTTETLEAIERRRQDNNLYLGVVGEFSSGKSTFLNAILRDDLLRTDVLQATTAAVTWLRYGQNVDVQVEFEDGSKRTFREGSPSLQYRFKSTFSSTTDRTQRKDGLRDFIHAVTAEEQHSSELRCVTIYHPSNALQSGLVICDTPGANAEIARHAEVAGQTLTKECDAAIVVIPADIPVSESLLSFLRTHLADCAHRCTYVVTKLDLIRSARERERLLKAIESRLRRGLDIEQVTLVACAPRIVMDEVTGEANNLSSAQQAAALREFEQVQEQIWRNLVSNREFILLERLSVLMSRIFGSLPSQLAMLEATYEQQHQALEQNRIQDLGKFARRQKHLHVNRFTEANVAEARHTVQTLHEIRDESLARIQQRLFSEVSDTEELKRFVEQDLPGEYTRMRNAVEATVLASYKKIARRAKREQRDFEGTFRKRYENLATLGGKVNTASRMDIRNIGTLLQFSETDEVDRLTQLVKEGADTSAGVSATGATAGAAIGTMITPVIGTLIGGALGWFAGKMFAPSLAELQQQTWERIQESVETSSAQANRAVREAVEKQIAKAEEGLGAVIEDYVDQYGSLVREMIARDGAELGKLEQQRAQIRADQDELNRRRSQIDDLRSTIRFLRA